MKKRNPKLNISQRAALALTLTAAFTGCTHVAAQRSRMMSTLNEESKALTTAVVETLQAQPETNRDVYTSTALEFAKQDQRVEGLPLQPFDVPALLSVAGGATNTLVRVSKEQVEEAREAVVERFQKQNDLLARRAKAEAALIDLGVQAEAARNERITRWTKFSVGGLTLLGGAIALCVFFPIAIPIGGRFLGWLVTKIPALASATSVVSVKAFDAIVRAIEKAKQEPSPGASTVSVANSGDSRRGPAEDWLGKLHTQLSREMDAAHKALVRARKTQLS